MPWASIIGAVAGPLIGGMLSDGGSGGGNSQQAAAAAADPFGAQRPQYQAQLQNMMQGNFTPSDPSYAWRKQQGMDAVNRGTAASGGLNSGGRLTALENYGQGLASTEYQNQFARLSQLSGANSGSTGTAGQLIGAQNTQNQNAMSVFGNQIGGLATGAYNTFQNSGGGMLPNYNTFDTSMSSGLGNW